MRCERRLIVFLIGLNLVGWGLWWVGPTAAQVFGTVNIRAATTGAVISDVTVTNSSTELAPVDTTRLTLICKNNSSAENVRVGLGATPTASSGVQVAAGETISITGQYAVNAIREGGTNVTVSCSRENF